jgi:ABC-type uncharacterized transport system involved in gliding motility auxiliary subunit
MALTRATRSWAQLALHVCLLLVGLGLLQVVAERTNRRLDLTPGRALSLAPVTRQVLAEVSGPLRISVFFRRGTRAHYADLLARLRAASAHVDVALFDLDRYPERARGLGVTHYGRAAIEYEGRQVVAPALPQEELAGGILRALRGTRRPLAFTAGHGERAPGGDEEDCGRLTSALEAENYGPRVISLLEAPVPPDTDVVVVAGPRHDFLGHELDALAAYLKAGGGVLMLLEPGRLPNLTAFLASMGVALGDDAIVDPKRRLLGTDGLAAVVELFRRGNPVSDPPASPLESGVVLPSARTVDVVTEVPGVDAESIARTAPSAWAMADVERARRGEGPSEALGDRPGPASVVVMAEVGRGAGATDGSRRGRLVVVGDADFTSDAYLDLLGNRDLALNAVAWVAREPVLAGGRPARVPEIMRPLSPLVMTEAQARTLFVACVIGQPGLVLVAGLAWVGLRRRRG